MTKDQYMHAHTYLLNWVNYIVKIGQPPFPTPDELACLPWLDRMTLRRKQ